MADLFAIVAGLLCLWSANRLAKATAHYNSLSIRLDALLKENLKTREELSSLAQQRIALIRAEVSAIEDTVNAGYTFHSAEAAQAFEEWRTMARDFEDQNLNPRPLRNAKKATKSDE